MAARLKEDFVMAIIPVACIAAVVALFAATLIYGPRYKRTVETVEARAVTAEELRYFDQSSAILGGAIGYGVGSLIDSDLALPGAGIGFMMGGSKRSCQMPVVVGDSLAVITAPRHVCREVMPGQSITIEEHTETKTDKDGDILSVTAEYRWP